MSNDDDLKIKHSFSCKLSVSWAKLRSAYGCYRTSPPSAPKANSVTVESGVIVGRMLF